MSEKIYVTKSFLPPLQEYVEYLREVWRSDKLTNQGACVKELEERISNYLHADYLHYLSNGTISLQLALSSLNINGGEIITTPFSYVATISSILWERCTPVFVDIEPDYFCMDADKIEQAITKNTRAILPVHVFGYACNVEKIAKLANKYSLKVIYDGAHAFGSCYKGKSLLLHGDITTCSFHATKLFHTVEGGACITSNKEVSDKLEMMKRFGHEGDVHIMLGINAKSSEFHAAMGLLNLKYLDQIISKRRTICEVYDSFLSEGVRKPLRQDGLCHNYSYYPILFESEERLLEVLGVLNSNGIFPRRYFYPSLNRLPYLKDTEDCPISESISKRIVCLPLYAGLSFENSERICDIINNK